MDKMKLNLLRFLVSRAGGIITPVVAGVVATAVAKLAAFDANLASSIDQTAIVAFVVAAVMSAVNYVTNAVQTDGIKKIQALVNTDQDGIPGPVTYTEVRKALPME
jgi:hydroxylamine reductase (hybrid-cluster protein)